MARPATITEHQILDAARAVFLERGITATTAEVARRAGIAEGSIFKKFKTKAELFHAAMVSDDEPEFLKSLEKKVGKGDLVDTLVELSLGAIHYFRELLPLQMMMFSNPPLGSNLHPATVNPPALRALKRLTGFFEAEIRARRLRRHDPEIIARALCGSMWNYVYLEMIMKAHDELPLPEETYVRGLVNLLWNGAQPQP